MTTSPSPSQRRSVASRDGLMCHYCGVITTFEGGTVDHVWPVALGGRTTVWNLVWACSECNIRWMSQAAKCPCETCRSALRQHLDEPERTANRAMSRADRRRRRKKKTTHNPRQPTADAKALTTDEMETAR